MSKQLERITPQSVNFTNWYTDVVKQSGLFEYGPVKGTMILEPYGYAIWNNIRNVLTTTFNNDDIDEVAFPMLIPLADIQKEADHIKGFAPELAIITKIGEKDIDAPLVLRPTSEVLFGQYFSKKIETYKDLPLKLNQWANVVRWEKNTRPFLRSSEFYWQEGHTCHETTQEAKEMAEKMINVYGDFFRNYLAIPVIQGVKSEKEKFAGAETTHTIEAIMKDGHALQSGTSHYLGKTFSNAFNIKFNKDNKLNFVEQTSWGISTRTIGALIMTHGDDKGLILPPMIAPFQVVVIELFAKKNENVSIVSKQIKDNLKNYRVRIDNKDQSIGKKSANWEIKGVPIRIEVGPRDIENNEVVIVRRDTNEKQTVKINDVPNVVEGLLKEIQTGLLNSAKTRRDEKLVQVNSYDEFKKEIENKNAVIIPWSENKELEEKIKEETSASSRCYSNEFKMKNNKCIFSNEEKDTFMIFARAY